MADELRMNLICPRCKVSITLSLPIPDRMKTADVLLRWSANLLMDGDDGPCGTVFERDGGAVELLWRLGLHSTLLSTRVVVGQSRNRQDGHQDEWGLMRLAPGVWKLSPSVVEGEFHGFLTLIGVPDPAPFQGAGHTLEGL